MTPPLSRRLVAEALGSFLLFATVVGSGLAIGLLWALGWGAAVLAGFFHYVRIGPNRVEEDEHPTAPDTSVHVVDPAVHTFDPRGEDRP